MGSGTPKAIPKWSMATINAKRVPTSMKVDDIISTSLDSRRSSKYSKTNASTLHRMMFIIHRLSNTHLLKKNKEFKEYMSMYRIDSFKDSIGKSIEWAPEEHPNNDPTA
ncbi:Uncharacterized protein Fot_07923 [Forsythia ovata]|uniref:Uncharacterized protein n=1 Tax=Forsythia ovata TaxID=205694 RepID=A0ABD1WXC2_9LAMI